MNITVNTSSISQFQLASRYLSHTFALPLCIIGILGNLLNVIVFVKLNNYKHNASSFYILCKTFYDLLVLVLGLGLRVLDHSFQVDLSVKSRFWCRIRLALLEFGVFNSLTCLCLQSIDAYFSSSPSVTLRRKSQIQTARYIIFAFACFWFCHQIPSVIFQDLISIKGKPACRTTSKHYSQYRNYFVVIAFSTIIPLIIIGIFGFLTYRQLHAIDSDQHTVVVVHRRSARLSHLTKQITNMILVQIMIVLCCETPFAVVQIYTCATKHMSKSALQQAEEQLIQMVVVTCNYSTFASSFYCYYVASKRFRKQTIEVLTLCPWHRKNQPLSSSSETTGNILNQQLLTQI
ncbi:unnamed protein product [Adineta ricciae]|uniref:G-protein coupled receptors family 1 profile domain-containing protein n=2 Tax=Adineta ricciae TaxID=249248 RepID=A0A815D3Z4_ADIRI|nr:unnamed protein product [Adineta ricciae]